MTREGADGSTHCLPCLQYPRSPHPADDLEEDDVHDEYSKEDGTDVAKSRGRREGILSLRCAYFHAADDGQSKCQRAESGQCRKADGYDGLAIDAVLTPVDEKDMSGQ